MLLSLSIQNLILIDSLTIDFEKGLSAFTGETGAGKSIILDALMYTLGERTNSKLIKDPSKNAVAVATFNSPDQDIVEYLKELGIDASDELILRRVISPDGKSKAFVNDTSISIGALQELSKNLIEICGQHDSRGLMNSSSHLGILDTFSKVDKTIISSAHSKYSKIKRDLSDLKTKLEKAEIEKSYLLVLIEELDVLNPQPHEEQTLADKRKFLSESSKISEALESSMDKLGNSKLMSELYAIQRDLEKYEQFFALPLKSLNSAIIELSETANVLQDISRKNEFDATTLEEIEERLFKLRSVARKYHTLSDLLPEFLATKKAELELIDNSAEAVSKLEKMLIQAKEEYLKIATDASKKRAKAAEALANSVSTELKNLKMDKADFKVETNSNPNEDNWTSTGFDQVSFVIKTNPRQPYTQLAKTASGGELSRTMLAIKVALTSSKSIPTLIFDEIDTGISGAVSDAVGRKLAELALSAQVLIVTHQPQVVAYSNHHFLVAKETNKDSTSVNVRSLNSQEKQAEIARMLSGQELSDESLAAAKRLMQSAA
jgi:DNA repair protein RecN (Recombination protein N)